MVAAQEIMTIQSQIQNAEKLTEETNCYICSLNCHARISRSYIAGNTNMTISNKPLPLISVGHDICAFGDLITKRSYLCSPCLLRHKSSLKSFVHNCQQYQITQCRHTCDFSLNTIFLFGLLTGLLSLVRMPSVQTINKQNLFKTGFLGDLGLESAYFIKKNIAMYSLFVN